MPSTVINTPRLRQCYTVEVVEPHTVFLLSEHRHLVFEGEIYVALMPLLDGHHTFAEMLAKVGQKFSFTDVYGALTRLTQRHCIVEADEMPLPDHVAFWDHLSVETGSQQVLGPRPGTSVTIQTVGDLAGEVLEAALKQAGLCVESDGALLIVMTDDYLREELATINRQALASGRPWMLLKPDGVVVWVGPLFRPGETGCWQCLEQRLRANRQVEHYIQNRSIHAVRFDTSKVQLASTLQVGVNLAATEVARSLALDAKVGLDGKVLTVDLLSFKLAEHILVKRPQCPACGQPQPLVASRPVTLTSRQKRRGMFAGGRTATPEEICHRYQYHMSPITGVVTSCLPLDSDTYGMAYNYVVGHYFPALLNDTAALRVNQFSRSGGKGATESQAKASALAEAFERYSGICWGDESTVRASYASLQPQAIHLRDIVLFSDNQYSNRQSWNAQCPSERHYVPEPFDSQAEIAWTPVWSLSHDRLRYLPTAVCFYGHRDPGHFFALCDSNGCAAGNTLEEAIVQGFLELVERDSVALWWYNRLRRPAVDVASFGLPYWEHMRAYYQKELQRDLHVLDITADLEIPTFVVVSRRMDRVVEDILVGFGSHLDPRTAMMHALAEINQSMPAVRHAAPDGSTIYRFLDQEMRVWLQTATYAHQPYLIPDPDAPPKTLADYQQLASDDVKDDVLTCVRLAQERGLEVLMLDQTRPDVGMPVVRVVVPGLRHFWRRLGPGRLYDVPVQLGWLKKPLAEEVLNPISCFI